MPVTVSSTTVDTVDSSCCRDMATGCSRTEKRRAAMFTKGRQKRAISPSCQSMASRNTATRITVTTLAMVIGIIVQNWLICWRSVADLAIS